MDSRNHQSQPRPVTGWEYWKQFKGGLMQVVAFAIGTAIVLLLGLLFLLWVVVGHPAH